MSFNNKIQYFIKALLTSCFVAFIFACNPTKHLKPDELFLQNSTIKIDTRKVDKDELKSYLKQKPNRKILGVFRYHLGVFNAFNKKGVSDFRQIGEAPVVYDSLVTAKSATQLGLYLKSKSYFDNNVTYTTKIHKNKVKVKYTIKTGEPYIVKWIDYKIEDPALRPIVVMKHYRSFIKKNKPLDMDVLENERQRIRDVLRDEGYFYFTKDYVKFKIDTTIGNKEVNVYVQIENKNKNNDSITNDLLHRKSKVSEVNVYLSHDFINKNIYNFDTTSYNGLIIAHDYKLIYKPKIINHAVNIKPNEFYSLEDQQATYKHFSELGLFRTVNIQYDKQNVSSSSDSIQPPILITNIFLTPQKIKSSSIEATGTNSGGNLGIKGGIVYLHKNLFHSGERLTVRLNGGLEVQQLINQPQKEQLIFGVFNTFEFGPEVNLEIPRFLLPISFEKFSKNLNPKTSFNYILNYQNRPEYERNLTQFSFGYFWNAKNKYKKHFLNPFTISLIKIHLTEQFKTRIEQENNPFIISSFTDHLISASNYTYVYNNQTSNKTRDFKFFRFSTEFAGNTLWLSDVMLNTPKNEKGGFEYFHIQYAQYMKFDFDYRYYNQAPFSALVSRIAFGIGRPYGNLNVLPFEKSYFGGGANGIRAWQARTLGPGSLPDSLISTQFVNQIGEIKIEGNLEYRFDITKLFKGAVFVDAGNIWITRPDEQRPNAEIRLDKFWQDVAVGTGIGLRLDFGFFLFRFDLAAKLKDPASLNPNEFNLHWKTPNLNLGIGYPF